MQRNKKNCIYCHISCLEDFLLALESNQQLIARVCNVYVEGEEDRRDLYQELLLQPWKLFDSIRGEAQVSTWVYRVYLNTGIRKKYRKKHEQHVRMEDLEWVSTTSENPDERLEYLRQCIKMLRDVEQMLVILFQEDLSFREIRYIVGISENHVAVKMKRIREKLFHCIS